MHVYGELVRAQLETVTADPSGVTGRVIYRTDLKLAKVYDGTIWRNLGSGGGGSSLTWRLTTNSPIESDVSGLEVLDFNQSDSQEVFAQITVPSDYVAGKQVVLSGGVFATTAVVGNVRFRCLVTLARPGSGVLGSLATTYTSALAQVTVNAIASTLTAIGDIDVTDAAGLVGATAIQAGDVLFLKLYRDVASESVPAASNARFLRFSMFPKFS